MELPSSSTPERDGSVHLAYEPALDGLRAVAVIAVCLFHGGVSVEGGGFLGVEAFFVLSGYLITSLLLTELASSSRIRLGRFWARRARRLLPALFVMVAAVTVVEALRGSALAAPGMSGDAIASLFYVANWHEIARGSGYFVTTGRTSPLQHTWSLAIEEQFYLLWPLVVLAVAWAARRLAPLRKLSRDGAVMFTAVAGALVSSWLMAHLYAGGTGLNRVYYGTDTRAQGLLAGAALAAYLRWRPSAGQLPGAGASPRAVARATAGVVGLAGLAVASVVASGRSAWLFEGGMLGVDLAAVAVIVSVVGTAPKWSPVRVALAARPLRAIGRISYGIYLWHFPLFIWLDSQSTGASGASLLAIRLAATGAVALLSYQVIEQPIRTRRIPSGLLRVLAPAAAAATVAMAVAVGPLTAAPVAAHLLPARGIAARSAEAALNCRRAAAPGSTRTVAAPVRCAPVRVLLLGDSVALTLGPQLAHDAGRFGVTMIPRAWLGCSFGERGLVNGDGSFVPQAILCKFSILRSIAAATRPDVIVVEMGWWDSMDRLWAGHVVHLGTPVYDAYLRSRVAALISEVAGPKVPVVLLSVPWMQPGAWANGELPPAASPARHEMVNSLLRSVAATSRGRARYFDIGPYVTPGNRFSAEVGGSVCRQSDGIHFYFVGGGKPTPETVCGQRLQDALLPYLVRLARSVRGA